MGFERGKGKTGGRQKGTPNKLTATVKEVVLDTFNKLQEDKAHNMLRFAKDYPVEFYKIAAKLIPTDLKSEVTNVGEQSIIIKGDKFADRD